MERVRARHWDAAYDRVGESGGSWSQAEPTYSLKLVLATGVSTDTAVIDAGGGASTLVDRLLISGFTDLTVLDVSSRAILLARERLGRRDSAAHWVVHDVLSWAPDRRFGVWHDRAVFHFLVSAEDRRSYFDVLSAATQSGSHAVIGTFAADGPRECSALPVVRYSPTELDEVFREAGWRSVSFQRENHRTPGGAVQPFTWGSFVRE